MAAEAGGILLSRGLEWDSRGRLRVLLGPMSVAVILVYLTYTGEEGESPKVRWIEDRAGGLSPLSEKYAWLQHRMDGSQQMLYGAGEAVYCRLFEYVIWEGARRIPCSDTADTDLELWPKRIWIGCTQLPNPVGTTRLFSTPVYVLI
jgi:hypothetical protein